LASLGVSLDGRGSGQSDSVSCEPRHCASKDTLSESDLAHVCKCVLGRQQVSLLLCLRQVHLFFLVILYYWLFSRTICSVVTCEREKTTLPCNPLSSQNPRSPETSPLGLTSLKRKNHPIVVTLGGIGSCYASLTFKPQAFYPCYKLCDNMRDRPSLGSKYSKLYLYPQVHPPIHESHVQDSGMTSMM
jgi:hypothetical protein